MTKWTFIVGEMSSIWSGVNLKGTRRFGDGFFHTTFMCSTSCLLVRDDTKAVGGGECYTNRTMCSVTNGGRTELISDRCLGVEKRKVDGN